MQSFALHPVNTGTHLPSSSEGGDHGQEPTIILSNGKKVKVTKTTSTILHGRLSRLWLAIQVIFMTLLTFGTGPFWWKSLKERWEQLKTGEKKITVYTQVPVEEKTINKTNQIGNDVISKEGQKNIDEEPKSEELSDKLKMELELTKKLKAEQEMTPEEAAIAIDVALAKKLQEEADLEFAKGFQKEDKAAYEALDKAKKEAGEKGKKDPLEEAEKNQCPEKAILEFNEAIGKLESKGVNKQLKAFQEIDYYSGLTVNIGDKVDSSILKNTFPQTKECQFELNEIAIVVRTGPPIHYQYVEIKGINKEEGTIEFFDGESHYTKPLLCFYKLSAKIPSKQEIQHLQEHTEMLKLAEKAAHSQIKLGDFEKAMQIRMQAATAIPPTGPLAEIHLRKEDPIFGFRLQPIGSGFLKNHSLFVQTQPFTDGSKRLHVEGKLSYPKREELTNTLNYITKYPNKFLQCLPKGFCQGITTTLLNDSSFYGRTPKDGKPFKGPFSTNIYTNGFAINGQETVIDFKGVGRVSFHSNPEYLTLYNRFKVDLDPTLPKEEAAEKLHVIFASLGLGAISSLVTEEDIQRIKIMQLFRVFYPKEAYDFERGSNTFEESIESLKIRIMAKVSDMKNKFMEYLDQMYLQKVYEDQSIWAVKGLAQKVRGVGGLGLVSNIYMPPSYNFTHTIPRIISILTNGILSAQDRFQIGNITQGASNLSDFAYGSADHVFTRMVTDNMSTEFSDYQSPVKGITQILYKLELIERGGYAYPEDNFGKKSLPLYKNRPNIIDLAKQLKAQKNHSYCQSNEVCIRHRIPSEFINGIVVRNQSEKDTLIDALRIAGLITKNYHGKELINSIPIDKFIHIGKFEKEDFLA